MIKINNKVFEQSAFPDGTPLLKTPNSLNSDEQVITWLYDDMKELFAVYCITKHLQSMAKTPVRLVMPYVPNARQDRTQNEKEDVFTLKWFCDIVNSLEFSRVTIVDVHSTVAPDLLNNCHSINNQKIFDIVKGNIDVDLVFYPDNGASKKYSEYIKSPNAFGIKKRDWETGKILGLDIIGDVQGKNILIVDDISSFGGTFYHSAKKLKDLGAKNIYLLITHCEDSILKGDLINSGLIEKIYTTNSIYRGTHKLIEVIHTF